MDYDDIPSLKPNNAAFAGTEEVLSEYNKAVKDVDRHSPLHLPATTSRTIREGDDVEIDAREVPYEYKGTLGVGGHAFVEEVRDVLSGALFARKTFKRNRRASKQIKAMLLQPVADGNLADFLAHFRDLPENHTEKHANTDSILRAFGCLAHALEYMHREGFGSKPIIRHKDIKPKNILLLNGYVLLTDFGISRSCARDHTTTDGRPEFFTAVFCAPEVADYDKRNRKSDVFSLGCVFFEMLAALFPDEIPDELLSDYSVEPYHRRIHPIHTTLRACSDTSLARLIRHMLNPNLKDRPSACDVTIFLREAVDIPRCDKCASFDSSLHVSNTFSSHISVFGNSTDKICRPNQIAFTLDRLGCPYPHCAQINLPWEPITSQQDFSVQSFACGFCTMSGTLYGAYRDLLRIRDHLEARHAHDFPRNWFAIQYQLPFGKFEFHLNGDIIFGEASRYSMRGQYVLAVEDVISFEKGTLSYRKGDRVRISESNQTLHSWWEGELSGKKGLFPIHTCKFEGAFNDCVATMKEAYVEKSTGFEFREGNTVFITRRTSKLGTMWEGQRGGKIGRMPAHLCKNINNLSRAALAVNPRAMAILFGPEEDASEEEEEPRNARRRDDGNRLALQHEENTQERRSSSPRDEDDLADYVLVEKRRIEIDALADEIAAQPEASSLFKH